MNFSKRNKSIVDFIFIIALFGAFAISGLLVVLFGAKVYKATVEKMDANYASRTALSYVTEKVRSHDFAKGEDSFIIDEYKGQSVLILKQTINDRVYDTYLFVEEGMLKEYTTADENEFNYDSGTDILPIESFTVEKSDDSLYRFKIEDTYDNVTDFYVAIYSMLDGEA